MKKSDRDEDQLWGAWSNHPEAIKPTDEELQAIREHFASQDLSVENIVEAKNSLRELDRHYERRNKIRRRVALIATMLIGVIFDRVALAMGWIRPEWLLSYHLKRLWHWLFG
jgi:hypothetical protein